MIILLKNKNNPQVSCSCSLFTLTDKHLGRSRGRVAADHLLLKSLNFQVLVMKSKQNVPSIRILSEFQFLAHFDSKFYHFCLMHKNDSTCRKELFTSASVSLYLFKSATQIQLLLVKMLPLCFLCLNKK